MSPNTWSSWFIFNVNMILFFYIPQKQNRVNETHVDISHMLHYILVESYSFCESWKLNETRRKAISKGSQWIEHSPIAEYP